MTKKDMTTAKLTPMQTYNKYITDWQLLTRSETGRPGLKQADRVERIRNYGHVTQLYSVCFVVTSRAIVELLII